MNTKGIAADWRAGMSYDDLHAKYGPWAECECDVCERGRQWERAAEVLDDARDHSQCYYPCSSPWCATLYCSDCYCGPMTLEDLCECECHIEDRRYDSENDG